MAGNKLVNRISKTVTNTHRKFYGTAIGLAGGSSLIYTAGGACSGSCASCASCAGTLLLAAGIIAGKVISKKDDESDGDD